MCYLGFINTIFLRYPKFGLFGRNHLRPETTVQTATAAVKRCISNNVLIDN